MPGSGRRDRITSNTGHAALAYLWSRGTEVLLRPRKLTMRLEGAPRSPAAPVIAASNGTRGSPTPPRHPLVRTETSETGGAEAAPVLPLLAAWAHGLRMMINGFSWTVGTARATLVRIGERW
jgi:hypothetical protein